VITAKLGNMEFPYYVGRTKNLRRRLYNNHLMGPATNARLKKHLVAGGECADMKSAKQFLKDTCSVRWILQDGTGSGALSKAMPLVSYFQSMESTKSIDAVCANHHLERSVRRGWLCAARREG